MEGKIVELEGQKFSIGLPLNEQGDGLDWHDLLYQSNNWFSEISSWTSTRTKKGARSRWVFGGKDWQQITVGMSDLTLMDTVGFRPVITPLSEDGQIDADVFAGVAMGETVKMYTMLLDGKPVEISETPAIYNDEQIDFTDRYYGEQYLIPWTFCGNHAICTVNMLVSINLEDLINAGFTS